MKKLGLRLLLCLSVFSISVLLHRDTVYSFQCAPFRRHMGGTHIRLLQAKEDHTPLTSALLKLSYDGGRSTGWSAANKGTSSDSGFVRSIQGIVQDCLSRLYGNLPVIVEGCSRTDEGVHARSMVAQFYCVDPILLYDADKCVESFSIPGKKQPHPWNATDTSCFKPLPTPSLEMIRFKLNRMLPSDVRVLDVAPVPTLANAGARLVFHPTLSCSWKTYQYNISAGQIHDPTRWRSMWHVGDQLLDLPAMRKACSVLVGSHNFQAFQGSPRGKDDKQKRKDQNARCTLRFIDIEHESAQSWIENTVFYSVTVIGDRFLYKMVRMLVGALVAVGQHRLNEDDIRTALITGERPGTSALACAPAKGLVLVNVDYGQIAIDWISKKII